MMLSVIENPTRRRILEALVREPHYPLQLSKELGLSQQGIMKHLRMMEDMDLVRSFSEESDQGGPARRRYFPTTGFTIVVDIGPGLFNTEIATHHLEGPDAERPETKSGRMLLDLREELRAIDEELDSIKERRAHLITDKESLLEEVGHIVESDFEDYGTRRVVYEYIKHPDIEGRDLAVGLGLRDDVVERIITQLGGDVDEQ